MSDITISRIICISLKANGLVSASSPVGVLGNSTIDDNTLQQNKDVSALALSSFQIISMYFLYLQIER